MAAMPDERRDGYLDREGWQKLASLASDVQHLAVSVGKVVEIAERNDRTLRGHNGTPGVVAGLDAQRDRLNALLERLDTLDRDIDVLIRPGKSQNEEKRLVVWGKWAVAVSALSSLGMHILEYFGGLIP